MATLTIAYEVSADKFNKIEQLIESELTYNSYWSGASIDLIRGDFTSMSSDSEDANVLFHAVQEIILN